MAGMWNTRTPRGSLISLWQVFANATNSTLLLLQRATEEQLVTLLEHAFRVAIISRRVTLMAKDVTLSRFLLANSVPTDVCDS